MNKFVQFSPDIVSVPCYTCTHVFASELFLNFKKCLRIVKHMEKTKASPEEAG